MSRKIIVLIILFVINTCSANARVRLGYEVGINRSSIGGLVDGQRIKDKYITGYRGGLLLDIKAGKKLYVQTGAFFSRKGSDEDYTEPVTTNYGPATLGVTVRIKLRYIELPVNFVYKFAKNADSQGAFFLSAGPYFGFALGGNVNGRLSLRVLNTTYTESVNEAISIGNDKSKDDIRRLDMGLKVGAGYQFKFGMYLRLQYGFSISNNTPGGNENNTMHNHAASFSMGILINK